MIKVANYRSQITKWVRALLIAMVFCSLNVSAVLANVKFEVTVNSNKLTLGSSGTLTISLSGAGSTNQLKLPVIDGLQTKYATTSTEISTINGVTTSTNNMTYLMYPTKLGKFQIPAMSIEIDGQVYTSDAIDIEVVEASGADVPSDGKPTLEQIFLRVDTPATEMYLNQKIPLDVKFYVAAGLDVRDLSYPDLEHVGFKVDEYVRPSQTTEVFNGVRYNLVYFTTHIYPMRSGTLTLGPAKMTGNLLKKAHNRRSSRGRSSFFDDDFFDSFFTSYTKQPIMVTSPTFDINVKSLPEQGKPSDFSGAVGQFSFTSSVGPNEVSVGDPLTLRMTISGDGNLDAVKIPKVTGSDFKVYDPEVKQDGNVKIIEQVVIPTNADITEFPTLTFSYFNPKTGQYQSIKQGPFDLDVNPPKEGEGFTVVGFDEPARVTLNEEYGRDLVFIKDQIGAVKRKGHFVLKSFVYYLIVVLYLLIWAGLFMYYRFNYRLKTDAGFARSTQAPKAAKKGLDQAKKLIAEAQVKEFYSVLFKTLKDYLVNKFQLSTVGELSFKTIEPALYEHDVEHQIITKIQNVFETSEMIRFASAQVSEGKMRGNYMEVEEVIDYLERHLR